MHKLEQLLGLAMVLPSGFPCRDLILLTAFSVVFGTLVIQGPGAGIDCGAGECCAR